MANLTNPSEVRRFLQMGRRALKDDKVPAELLVFAHRILQFRYSAIRVLTCDAQEHDLLFAIREEPGNLCYSEFQMSAGERAVLRLSRDISGLRDALVLIDELEAGLHPFTQQQLMLELQRLALRNDLQIIVTTHSPAVLESVPPEARIFLERTGDTVVVKPVLRDVIQRVLYGRPLDRLLVLCEDEVAEAIIQGVLDVLGPRLDLTGSNIEIGRDTGESEFPGHVKGFALFGQLENLVVVLDGDARSSENAVRQAAGPRSGSINLLFLPGDQSPEAWLWDCLRRRTADYAEVFGMDPQTLASVLDQHEGLFAGATDSKRNIAKHRLGSLAEDIRREVPSIARFVGRHEAHLSDGALVEFRDQLHDIIERWRSG